MTPTFEELIKWLESPLELEMGICTLSSRDELQELKNIISSTIIKPEIQLIKRSDAELDKQYVIYKSLSEKVMRLLESNIANFDYYEIDYSDAPGVIWEDQILNFDISLNVEYEYVKSSEFNQFLERITKSEGPSDSWNRYESMLTITGYLIHEYRDLSNMKSIILMDANLSEIPEGGAGKGLFMQGIKQVRNIAFEDGKNFEFGSRFKFQQINFSTRVLFIDDVTKKFDFERLFSTISDGVVIERKYGHRFFISAEKSPRIVASTNYSIIGSGGSFERRKFEFEFSNHYNRSHTPFDEFKHNFFIEWSPVEWNKFYNLMFYACRRYLGLGLREVPSINRKLKQLFHSTSPEFFEFVQEGISLDTEYNKKDLHQTFIRQYPDHNQLKQRSFTAWLKTFAEMRNLKMNERKSGDGYFVLFASA